MIRCPTRRMRILNWKNAMIGKSRKTWRMRSGTTWRMTGMSRMILRNGNWSYAWMVAF
jgi:hypothetical protein